MKEKIFAITCSWWSHFGILLFTFVFTLQKITLKFYNSLSISSELSSQPSWFWSSSSMTWACKGPVDYFSSFRFSRSVVSDSLRPHESQHARPPCPSPTPGVHSDSWPSSQWCHPVISSSVIPFSSCPQSLPASESFPMSQLFTWGGQSTGVSA